MVSASILVALSCFAQGTPNLQGLLYPPLARAARIQGDVVISGGKAVSGPPLLRQAAEDNFARLNFPADVPEVVMHFALANPLDVIRTETVKKGDAFDRIILRLLRIPTVKTIEYHQCVPNPNIPNYRVDLSAKPVEAWVYAATMCVETSTSQTATV